MIVDNWHELSNYTEVGNQADVVNRHMIDPFNIFSEAIGLWWVWNDLQDSVGVSFREIQPTQYMTGGSISLPDGVTVVSNDGTGTVDAAGNITGDVFDITLSNGGLIPFGNEVSGFAWDVVNGGTFAISGVTCSVDETCQFGSDHLNQYGYHPGGTRQEECLDTGFTSDAWWTKSATGVAISDGLLVVNRSSNGVIIAGDIGIQAGEWCQIRMHVTEFTGGDIALVAVGDQIGDGGANTITFSDFSGDPTGWMNLTVQAIAPTTGEIAITTGGTSYFKADSISVKRYFPSDVKVPYRSDLSADVLGNIWPIYPQIKTYGDSMSQLYTVLWRRDRQNITSISHGGDTSTQTKALFQAEADYYSTTIFFTGFNNRADLITIRNDLDEMIRAMKTNRWMVLGHFNASSEILGTSAHARIVDFNNNSALLYGDHYFDMRGYMIDQYDPNIPQDVIDHANDVTPTSLRHVGDSVHFIEAGFEILKDKVDQLLTERGYVAYTNTEIAPRVYPLDFTFQDGTAFTFQDESTFQI